MGHPPFAKITPVKAAIRSCPSRVLRPATCTADGVDSIIDGFTDADDGADFPIPRRGAHNLIGSASNQ